MQRSIEASRLAPGVLGLLLYASAFLFGAPAAYFPFVFSLADSRRLTRPSSSSSCTTPLGATGACLWSPTSIPWPASFP